MGLLSRKPKRSLTDFCRHFYESAVFAPNIDGIGDPWLAFCRSTIDIASKIDPSFSSIDFVTFTQELRALQLEVIGVSWFYRTKEELALAQSEFTKTYLINAEYTYLGEYMSAYNQAVSKSSTFGADPSSGIGRGRITMINSMRIQLFENWTSKGHEAEAAARVANRIGSNLMWNNRLTHSLLATELTRRLGYEGSDELWTQLMSVIELFYQGATQALSEVKITL